MTLVVVRVRPAIMYMQALGYLPFPIMCDTLQGTLALPL